MRLPFTTFTGLFNGTSDVEFDPARLASIAFIQGLDDGAPHTLLIDEHTDRRRRGRDAWSALPAPAGLAARGYDRHVDLTWSALRRPPICCTTASIDPLTAEPFVPVGIQKGTRHPLRRLRRRERPAGRLPDRRC